MLEYEALLREHMNISDNDTFNLVRAVVESDQPQFLVALTGKLYDKIQAKVDNVDFSYVSGSRGDITKIPKYNELLECLDIIRKIVIEYRQPTTPVDTVLTAIENLKIRKPLFTKAFSINAPFPVLTYNSLALAVVQSTSLMIATSIEFIKNPGAETFQMALDIAGYRKTMDNLLFTNLDSFNKSCASKEFDKSMNAIMERTIAREAVEILAVAKEPVELVDELEDKPAPSPFLSPEEIRNDVSKPIPDSDLPVQEKGMLSAFASYGLSKIWSGILNTIVPMVRNFVYVFQLEKLKASDYFQQQADLLQANALQLQYNDRMSDSEKKQIYKKQMQIVNKYKQKANALAIDFNTAKTAADRVAGEEARKFNASEIDYNPDAPNDAFYTANIFG